MVLLDFGFASPVLEAGQPSESAQLVGTLSYMAPECLWGSPPTYASDWYSVGALAAELLLGRPVFAGSMPSWCCRRTARQFSRSAARPSAGARRAALPVAGAASRTAAGRGADRGGAGDAGRSGLGVAARAAAGRRPRCAGGAGDGAGLSAARSRVGERAAARKRRRGQGGAGRAGAPRLVPRRWCCGALPSARAAAFGLLDEVVDQFSRCLKHLGAAAPGVAVPPRRAGRMSRSWAACPRARHPADDADTRPRIAAAPPSWARCWRCGAASAPDDLAGRCAGGDPDSLAVLRALLGARRPAPVTWLRAERTDSCNPLGSAAEAGAAGVDRRAQRDPGPRPAPGRGRPAQVSPRLHRSTRPRGKPGDLTSPAS